MVKDLSDNTEQPKPSVHAQVLELENGIINLLISMINTYRSAGYSSEQAKEIVQKWIEQSILDVLK